MRRPRHHLSWASSVLGKEQIQLDDAQIQLDFAEVSADTG